MAKQVEALRWLQRAVIGLFALALCAGIFQPLYSDEIGWRYQERAALDGVDKLLSDTCGPNTLAVPPFFMLPVRHYSAFFNTSFADPFYVRLSGVFYALCWLALLLALIRQMAAETRERAVLSLTSIGLMCLGLLPLLLILSRPEQPILLAVTAAVLLAVSGSKATQPASGRSAWLRSLAVTLLTTVALSYHVKGVLLSGLFLACLFFASRGRQASVPRAAMGAIMVLTIGVSARYWIHRMQCPDDPLLLAEYARMNMGIGLTNSHSVPELFAALGKIIGNVALLPYFAMPAPRPDPQSAWLPPDRIGLDGALLWFGGLAILWSGALLAALACGFTGAREAWRQRRLDARLTLAGLLFATLLGWSATQGTRNFYEASFFLPLLMLVILLAVAGRRRSQAIDRPIQAFAMLLGILALASVTAVAAIYGPSIAQTRKQAGYVPNQVNSLSVFGYAGLKPRILSTARQCGIGDPREARALMIDDLAYFAFMESRLPLHQAGVVGPFRGIVTDPVAYLKSKESDGAILGCHLLPDDLRRRARRSGEFCCLGKP